MPTLPVRVLWCLVASAAATFAAEPTPQQSRFFENRIRPVLVEHCQKCHGPEKQWSSLRLDSQEALLKGGDTGPAVVPGKPEESLLIKAVRQIDGEISMPPKSKLSEAQISDLVEWVRQGATYPSTPSVVKSPLRDPNHWAFQPPAAQALPAVRDSAWVQTGLDAFILFKLEAQGLTPAPAADKSTLIRRVTFDLTGLPPTPEEVAAFLADDSAEAYARLVDRLLSAPAYGERWGRHWLDVARYADSNGLDENVAHGNAWKYRDYVVSAFNQDIPYDQFLVEQLAGDLLPTTNTDERYRNLIATGFLSLGAKVIAEVDETKMQMDIVDEQIDTVSRALLGLTMGCARCHDHKFDPISTADYYGLAGIFKSTRTMETFTKLARWHENPLPTPESLSAKAAHEAQVAEKKAALEAFIAEADKAVVANLAEGTPVPDKKEPLYPEATKTELKQLRDSLKDLEKSAPEIPSAMGVSEDKPADVPIHVRGSHLKLGDVVPRHVPAVLRGPSVPEFTPQSSGRMELARWLVDPQHPLTARVMVNRVWRWHFGRGLVSSTDNFGLLGDRPTHPELLDWLAQHFIQEGWSLKTLHRTILLSSTYRQSSTPSPQTLERDPANQLWGRVPVRRLDAEEIRDSLLAVSGQLDPRQGGPVLKVKNRDYLFDHTSKDLTEYTSVRRSLYLPVIRNNVYDVFQLFDYPDAAVPNGNRISTTVAPQALMMLNSELVLQASDHLASRLTREVATDDALRIARLFQLAYGRDPTESELDEQHGFLRSAEQAFASAADAAARRQSAWSTLCQVILAANEFIYVN
ncbi:MAG: PSD1 and planctomycete cytochrome C domain-containing protein [Planctomycetaceae bacterium]|nr:PSD1 and planctomycete cytochrome C domain-containing protein [Planctomycetaceae bacterium]